MTRRLEVFSALLALVSCATGPEQYGATKDFRASSPPEMLSMEDYLQVVDVVQDRGGTYDDCIAALPAAVQELVLTPLQRDVQGDVPAAGTSSLRPLRLAFDGAPVDLCLPVLEGHSYAQRLRAFLQRVSTALAQRLAGTWPPPTPPLLFVNPDGSVQRMGAVQHRSPGRRRKATRGAAATCSCRRFNAVEDQVHAYLPLTRDSAGCVRWPEAAPKREAEEVQQALAVLMEQEALPVRGAIRVAVRGLAMLNGGRALRQGKNGLFVSRTQNHDRTHTHLVYLESLLQLFPLYQLELRWSQARLSKNAFVRGRFLPSYPLETWSTAAELAVNDKRAFDELGLLLHDVFHSYQSAASDWFWARHDARFGGLLASESLTYRSPPSPRTSVHKLYFDNLWTIIHREVHGFALASTAKIAAVLDDRRRWWWRFLEAPDRSRAQMLDYVLPVGGQTRWIPAKSQREIWAERFIAEPTDAYLFDITHERAAPVILFAHLCAVTEAANRRYRSSNFVVYYPETRATSAIVLTGDHYADGKIPPLRLQVPPRCEQGLPPGERYFSEERR